MTPCLACGKPTSLGARCELHRHTYGRPHVRAGDGWQTRIDAGLAICPRCHEHITPGTKRGRRPTDWQLDHRPDGSLVPAHALCNTRNWEGGTTPTG